MRYASGETFSLPLASDRPLATIWYRSAAFLATCGIRVDHYIRDEGSKAYARLFSAASHVSSDDTRDSRYGIYTVVLKYCLQSEDLLCLLAFLSALKVSDPLPSCLPGVW